MIKLVMLDYMKKIVLLAELVGARGHGITKVFDKKEKSSLIKQKIEFLIVEVPRRKAIRIQNIFKTQLKDREYHIVCDFKKTTKSRLKVSMCDQQYKHKQEESNFKYYEKIGE